MDMAGKPNFNKLKNMYQLYLNTNYSDKKLTDNSNF